MVSQITTGSPVDDNGRPFRRRRARPAIIFAILLLVVGLVTWIVALNRSNAPGAPTDCNQPTAASATSSAAPAPGAPPAHAAPTSAAPLPKLTAASRSEMLAVAPAPLSTFQVQVLNASSKRGEAQSVSTDLTNMGFNPVPDTPFADDTVYPNHDLACVGQIRFGPGGKAAAAAVWLALPCAQLVDDGRKGTSVDLVLGEYYTALENSQDAQAALDALRKADPRNPATGADPSVVKAVHATSC